MSAAQILTVAQMQAAEQAIFDTGTTVDELMAIAAGGASDWIRRVAAGRSMTVLCGPGNNGGDGYVIAENLRKAGNSVSVVAPMPPTTDAAKNARAAFKGNVSTSGGAANGEVFVDCLFGSGLSRPLSGEHALLLRDLAERNSMCIAVDLPSGVESDSGALLNDRLPDYDLTLGLGAWKFAHWMLPARRMMGVKRLVQIGVDAVEGAAQIIEKPEIQPPAVDAHKYTRGLCAVVGGAMPGASLLACEAAMRSGAGYVKLLPQVGGLAPAELVTDGAPLREALSDRRISSVLIGPGLGRDREAVERLEAVLAHADRVVLDADALIVLDPDMLRPGMEVLATPHDGELEQLCRTFSVIVDGRQARAKALANASGMTVLAKGPDSCVATPDGRLALAPPASSWLSVAGTGDVLAGIAVSRMAAGHEPFVAACEAVWLHSEAARACGAAFTADELAHAVDDAMRAAL